MSVLALDIGGANIKAAVADRVMSVPFALWRSPDKLPEQLAKIALDLGPVSKWCVTMTAELCDCFATKREGVSHVLIAVQETAGSAPVHVWTTRGVFVSVEDAVRDPISCAAANWHALATWVARRWMQGEGLLIDTGSTTTDIIRVCDGRVIAVGLTDTDRLASGELIYSGARRTPVMALGPTVAFEGKMHGVMAEYFATASDVHVLLGNLPENKDDIETADGRPMMKSYAAARVLRMIGADMETMGSDAAARLARAFADVQIQRVAKAIRGVVADRAIKRVVVAGSGSFLATRAAQVALPAVEQVLLSDLLGEAASSAACAVALLSLRNGGE